MADGQNIWLSFNPTALGVSGLRLWSAPMQGEPFNTDPYLRQLNRLLQRELAARDLHQAYCTKIEACQAHTAMSVRHWEAAKTLNGLILYHRGLPDADCGFVFGAEIPRVTIRIAAVMPAWLSQVAATEACRRMEQGLVGAYRRAARLASVRDCIILAELQAQARANQGLLR